MEIGVGPEALKVWKNLKAPFCLLSCFFGLSSRLKSQGALIEEL